MPRRVRMWFMRSESARGYALLSPTLVVVVLGLLFPLLILTTMSFWKQDYFDIIRTFTTENYAAFFEKKIYYLILYRSIRISALVTLVTIVLAYPLAYYIAFHVKKNKMMWIILVTIPFWTSYLLRVFAWKVILGYNGVVNSGLISLGVISAPLEFLLYNPTAVVITLAHAWAAVAILPIYVSLEKIDRSLIEAARDLGESAFMTFVRVTLPLSLPGVIAASLLVFIPTVGDYVTPALVGGTRGIMIGNIIQSMFGKALNWPLGGGAVDHLHADRHPRGVRAARRHPLVPEEGGIGGGRAARRDERSRGARGRRSRGCGRSRWRAPEAERSWSVCGGLPRVPVPAGGGAADLLVQRLAVRHVSAEGLHARVVLRARGQPGAAERVLEQREGCGERVDPEHRPRDLRRQGGDPLPNAGARRADRVHHGAARDPGDHPGDLSPHGRSAWAA